MPNVHLFRFAGWKQSHWVLCGSCKEATGWFLHYWHGRRTLCLHMDCTPVTPAKPVKSIGILGWTSDLNPGTNWQPKLVQLLWGQISLCTTIKSRLVTKSREVTSKPCCCHALWGCWRKWLKALHLWQWLPDITKEQAVWQYGNFNRWSWAVQGEEQAKKGVVQGWEGEDYSNSCAHWNSTPFAASNHLWVFLDLYQQNSWQVWWDPSQTRWPTER